MEAQHHQLQPNENGGSEKGSLLCRKTSTRWTPTTDQIRILKELYYNNDVSSPSADQIQRISASLRQYGKVECKNMFYWFQNHKARGRHKKRLTTAEPVVAMQKTAAGNGRLKYPTSSNGVSPTTAPSTGMLVVGQMGSCAGYGSATMEKSFRDCSGGSNSINTGPAAHNFGCVVVDPYSSPTSTLFEGRKQNDLENREEEVEENQDEVETPELKTLPLFPIHGEDINGFCNVKFPAITSDGFYPTTWFRTSEKSGSPTSLELSISSYPGTFSKLIAMNSQSD